jgi:hypothetical protein
MSATMSVAFSELTRVLPWSLRALGFHLGTAERGSDLIARAEAMNRNGLAVLRKPGSAIRALPPVRIEKNASSVRIDISGRSLIEMGPVAIDVAASEFERKGAARVRLVDVADLALAPVLMTLAVSSYGLTALALYRDRQKPVRWAMAAAMATGTGLAEGAAAQLESLGRLTDILRLGGISGIWQELERDAADGDGVIDIIVSRTDLLQPALLPGVEIDDVGAALSHAYANGFEALSEDIQHLYALERLTWAPSSERSRAQAGFQQQASAVGAPS